MDVPTMYLEEKADLLHRAVERLADETRRQYRSDNDQYALLMEIRGLASVLHTEADEWMSAFDRLAIQPTSTVKVVPNGG